MRAVLVTLLLFATGLVVLVIWMAGGVQSPRRFEGPVEQIGAPRVDGSTTTIDVMVWNIAWGYGWGSEGSGSARPYSHFERSVERMGEVVAALDPDLLLLQEVDFGSRRSHGVDQAARIAEATGLAHVARAESWTANWVPFPYWPPSDQFGTMRSGGAILSRWPIASHRVTLLPKPPANPFWYNLFYLFRYFQEVDIDAGSRRLAVFNAHLEAFDAENRADQARQWATALSERSGAPRIVGGDFNTVPTPAAKKSDFEDEPETSFELDPTHSLLTAVEGLRDAFGDAEAFTFPAADPNRKLDHVLVSDDFEVVQARVVTEAGDVSDHLPLWVRLRVR